MKNQRTLCIVALALMLVTTAGGAADKIFTIDTNGVYTHIDIDSLLKSALVVYIKVAPDDTGTVMGQALKINKKGKVKPKGEPVVVSLPDEAAPANNGSATSCGVGNNGTTYWSYYTWRTSPGVNPRIQNSIVTIRRGLPTARRGTYFFNSRPFINQSCDNVWRPVGSPNPSTRFSPPFNTPRCTAYGETNVPSAVPESGTYDLGPGRGRCFIFPGIDSSSLGRSDAPRIFGGAYNAYASPSNPNQLWGDYMYIYSRGGNFNNPGIGGGIVLPTCSPSNFRTIPTPGRTPLGITPLPATGFNRAAVLLKSDQTNDCDIEVVFSEPGQTIPTYRLRSEKTDSMNINNMELPTLADSSIYNDDIIRGETPAADDNLLFYAVAYNRSAGRFAVHPFDSDGKFTGQSVTSKKVGNAVRTLRAHVAGKRLVIVYTTGTETTQDLKVYVMDLPQKLN